jgi:inner membrane protein
MASIGHVAVGIAAARAFRRTGQPPTWRSAISWSALSLLPDADVIGFSLGVRYGDPWGHRGATHSLAAALIGGVVVGLAARQFNRPFRRTTLFAIAVLASHGLLDSLTDGGLGVALLWPFERTRFFAPWRPIPVAPIGLAFVSPYGLLVSLTELVLFAPLLLYGLRPAVFPLSRVAAALLAIWVVSVWLIASSDPVRERAIGIVLRENTAQAVGYSEAAFRTIVIGQSQQQVRERLGSPHGENWFYPSDGQRAAEASLAAIEGCRAIRFDRDAVSAAFDPAACREIGIGMGLSPADVVRRLGPPPESCWQYTWSPAGSHYRVRDVCFLASAVDEVIRVWR